MKVDISYTDAQTIATGLAAYLALESIAKKYRSGSEVEEGEVIDFFVAYPNIANEKESEALQTFVCSLMVKFEFLARLMSDNTEDEHSS